MCGLPYFPVTDHTIMMNFNKDDKYAWKGYDFNVLDELDGKDYIRQGSHRSKSLYITKEGEEIAKELLEKYNVADRKALHMFEVK